MKKPYLSFCLIPLILFSACSSLSPDPEFTPTTAREIYTLRWKVLPDDGGQVLPKESDYTAGSKVVLNAIAARGYGFEAWSGDVSGTGSSMEITMDSDKLVIANFSALSTATPRPTSTPRPSPTATPEPCRRPADVSPDDAGQLLEVCGEVTNWGTVPCPECARGGYSFLKLDNTFLIISYDWVFNNNWIGSCIVAADTVDMLGASPVFIFGTGEGYAGSKCTTKEDGTRSCNSGDYFMQFGGCGSE